MLRACDIKKVVDVVASRITIDKFSKVVSRDEIRSNEYNLNIPRYVDSSEKTENWDIYSSMFGGIPERELADLHEYWEAFPTLKETLFHQNNEEYCDLAVEDLSAAVNTHPSIIAFLSEYAAAFADFEQYLCKELIEGMATINAAKEEATLSENVFSRLSTIQLIDRYGVYQLLDDDWNQIAIDLEIIQTEGFSATKQVDPNMVLKKKDGKEQEVQEGWIGHVIPFDLVQETLLSDELLALREKELTLSEVVSETEGLLDELSEEDKSKGFVNEAQDAFVAAEIKKAIKAQDAEPDTLAVLIKADKLLTEEKIIKKQIKDDMAKLHIKTKETIEKMSDETAIDLIKEKWITPLVRSIGSMPQTVINELIVKLAALNKKYETTFEDVEKQISETEKSLIHQIDQLTGGDFDMKGLAAFKKLLGGE